MEVLCLLLYIAAVIAAFVLAAYLYITWDFNIFRKLGIPYERNGLLGAIGSYQKEGIAGFDQRLLKQYGRVVGYFNGRTPSLMVADPDMIKQICVKEFSNFVNRSQFGPVPKIVMDSIAETNDEHWKYMRCVLNPSFSTGKLKQMMLLIERCADLLVRNVEMHVKSKKSMELKHLMGCYSMDVIASTGFGIDLDSQSDADNVFIKYSSKAMRMTYPTVFLIAVMFPFLKPLVEKFDYKVFDNNPDKKKFLDMIKQIIEERRAHPDEGHRDLLQLMLNAHREDASAEPEDDDDPDSKFDFKFYKKRGLTNYEVFCNSHIFLLAGYDTSSNGLTFAAYLLALHQEVQEKLYREIMDNFGKEKPSYKTVIKLPYLENVFLETLRLYPPAIKLKRQASDSTVINGYHIPAGMNIAIPVYAIHHDPELWPDPEKFDPDRFLPENRSADHNYKWLPFGVGPRNCLGMRLALLEAKMALVALLQNFRFVVAPDTEIPVKLEMGTFTRAQNPLYIGVERREG